MKPLTHQALKEELDQTLSTLAEAANKSIEVAQDYHQRFLTVASQEDIEDAEDLYLVRTIATLMLGAGINYKAVEILLGEDNLLHDEAYWSYNKQHLLRRICVEADKIAHKTWPSDYFSNLSDDPLAEWTIAHFEEAGLHLPTDGEWHEYRISGI